MSTKAKVFCRISDYIEVHEADLYELLRATCSVLNLNTKGKSGLTLLVPDADYRKKIAELAYSADPEDNKKAGDMLNALIIRQPIKSVSEWKKDNIANSLYPNQVVEVESASGDSVKFKSGATATIDKKFIDASKKRNLAVWRLKGEIPPTTDKPAKPQPLVKKGSYMGGDPVENELRLRITQRVEALYAADMAERRLGSATVTTEKVGGCQYDRFTPLNKKLRDVFLEHTMSLVNYIYSVRKDMDLFYAILPLISFQKVDFYILFEPYGVGDKLIDIDLIKDWASETRTFDMQKTIDLIGKELCSAGSSAKSLSDRMAVLAAIDRVRMSIVDPLRSDYKKSITNAIAAYDDLSMNNSIAGVKDIFPEKLHNYYSSHPGLKLAHDDLRYFSSQAFYELESIEFDSASYSDIISKIKDVLSGDAGELVNRSVLFSDIKLKYSIPDIRCRMELAYFANSTYLMFIALSPKDMANLPFKSIKARPSNCSSIIWNIHGMSQARLKNVDTGLSNADIIREILTVNSLSDEGIKNAILDAAKKIAENEANRA